MRSTTFFALGLAAIAAVVAQPAPGCKVDSFQLAWGLDSSGHAVVGQGVHFVATFEMPIKNNIVQRDTQTGSLKMDYGDGTVEDTGVKTFDPPPHPMDWGGPWTRSFDHHYSKTGTFTASLKGGSVQPCATTAGMSYRITVVGNPTAEKRTYPLPVAPTPVVSTSLQLKNADGTVKKLVVIPPTPAYVAVGKSSALSHALVGEIKSAGLSSSGAGTFLTVAGSGRCGLRAVDTLEGTVVKNYDYKGTLPTTITIVNTAPGIHVVKIDGDKSSDSCAGTASASAAFAKK